MDLGRKIDERLWLLNRAGKIPFVVSGQGQEATPDWDGIRIRRR